MGIEPRTEVRRVVTTHDETGKAVVMIDDQTPHKTVTPGRGTGSWRVWVTKNMPVDMEEQRDLGADQIGPAPPKNGTAIRIMDFPPETPEIAKLPLDHLSKMIGGDLYALPKARPPRHPLMHRTRSIDYIIVLSGEIFMLLDDREVHLKAGDVVVQQATSHAWVNRGNEICRIAVVLIDGNDPLAE